MKTSLALAVCASALALAGGAQASTDRWFSYDADNDQAKHRTQDIHIWIRQGLFGSVRVMHLYRSRGDGFALKPVTPPWSEPSLKVALEGDPRGVSFYAVDAGEGAGFARGACHGASKAWLAMVPPRAYQPMRIVVMGDDAAAHAPVICEALDYRWRGEWVLPPQTKTEQRKGDSHLDKPF